MKSLELRYVGMLGVSIALIIGLLSISCDVQSGITKKSVEKYEPTPTPVKTVEVVEQIDPAEVVTADSNVQGPQISINPSDDKKSVDCTKFNRVMVNGNGKQISIKGVCKQLMINGDKNTITAVAIADMVVNGFGNNVQYSKYVNGKKPIVKDNGTDNEILKTEPPAIK